MDELKNLFNEFNEKPIAYHRIYSKITGGITTGLLLSQILYWAKTKNYKEFHKTNQEFSDELGMTLEEFKYAKKKLSSMNLVEIKRKGVPAKTYYKVDLDRILEIIKGKSSHQQDGENSPTGNSHQQVGEISPTRKWESHQQDGENSPTITETTTETTTEIPTPSAESTKNAPTENSDQEKELSKQIAEVIDIFYQPNKNLVSNNSWFGRKAFRDAAQTVLENYGYEDTIKLAQLAVQVQGEQYAPVITTPLEFRDKLIKLKSFVQRRQQEEKSKKRTSIGTNFSKLENNQSKYNNDEKNSI